MAYLKMNRFHWHLTDEPGWRLEIKKYPELTKTGARGNWSNPDAPAAFYTQADIREIVEYARLRHIMVIPEIDTPGHATAATRAYPELSGGGKGQWVGFTFNPAKEETYAFLGNVLKEAANLFPGPYIHIGGDEVHYGNQSWSTDPEIVNFTRNHGMTNDVELERYFIRRMAGVVNGLDKTPLGWDEITGAGVNPSNTVVMWWHHEKPEVLTRSLEDGYRVVLCPRLPCYFDFVQDKSHKSGRRWQGKFNTVTDVYAFPESTINGLVPQGKEANVLGMEACLWTEQIQNSERLGFMTYPRLAALAEGAWTQIAEKDEAGFLERLHLFLRELDRRHIPYFNPFDPQQTPEPVGPQKKTSGTANG
jgi:hexosaminidase